jgi:bifunctional DNase/RNase
VKCSINACSEKAIVHSMSAKDYRVIEEQHLCEPHAVEFLMARYPVSYQGNAPLALATGIEQFDIDLLAINERESTHPVYLLSEDGKKQFWISIGNFEAWALDMSLKGSCFARPPTHEMIRVLIASLGGRLQNVILDHYDHQAKTYHAKLRILHSDRVVKIDVRPSDAFNLAAIHKVPILIDTNIQGPSLTVAG